MKIAKCIILAGGFGTRLKSELPLLPKCLAPVDSIPFLIHQINYLKSKGIKSFIISLGYKAQDVITALNDANLDCDVEVYIEDKPLGTGGATLATMNAHNIEECYVFNGDTIANGSIEWLFSPLKISDSELVRLGCVEVSNRFRYGGVELNKDGFITEFIEKGVFGSGYINSGIYRINKIAFGDMTVNEFSLEDHIKTNLIMRGSVSGFPMSGPFIDIGTPEDYNYFKSNYRAFI